MTTTQNVTLSCENLSMYFGGLMALDRLALSVKKDEILGLIGPNGSGKTTFFNVVTGIYTPTEGVVKFYDQDITGLRPQEVYRFGIARTFQRSRLCLPLSIFDNIMIGNHKRLNNGLWFNLFQRTAFQKQYEENVKDVWALLQIFNPELSEKMFDAVANFPMIDRRRIEICRALISQPKLLLLDEPSAGMTHDETRQLMDDILEVGRKVQGLSIIIIEHEMSVIERITDYCVVLNFGKKIFEGPYKEVAANKDVQEAYLGGEDTIE